MNLQLTRHYHPKPTVHIRVPCWVRHLLWVLTKGIMTCIHCIVSYKMMPQPRKSSVLHPVIPLCPYPLSATDSFILSLVLSFPERHAVGIVQYSACSDRLLSNTHLRFLRGLVAHFFSVLSNVPLSGCGTVCPFTDWRESRLLPSLGSYE